jgi:hypothetical protein
MSGLLTDAQLGSIQKLAMLGMQTDVTILKRTASLGLETSDDPYGSSVSFTSTSRSTTVKGMLHSTPTPVAIIDAGQLVTVNTYRLWVPVDTDVTNGDRVLIGTNTYVVSDTTADETWPAFLACSLRLSE